MIINILLIILMNNINVLGERWTHSLLLQSLCMCWCSLCRVGREFIGSGRTANAYKHLHTQEAAPGVAASSTGRCPG